MSKQWKIRQTKGNNRYKYTLYRPHDHSDPDIIAEIEFTDAETAKELAPLLAAASELLEAVQMVAAANDDNDDPMEIVTAIDWDMIEKALKRAE